MLKLKQLREGQNLTQEDLAKRLSVHKRTVSNWESGFRNPNSTQRKKIAEFFGISEAELFGEPRMTETIQIPVLGAVPSERVPLVFDKPRGVIEVSKALVPEGKPFALEVRGDCLEAEGIYDGDVIIVSNEEKFINGKVYVVRVNDKYNCKRIFKFERMGNLVLQRVHSRFPEAFLVNPKTMESEIIGRVIASFRRH